MLINIDQITVGDRIRKDYGDIQELADDIRENTLLNPPVVTPNQDGTYTLIAGERRLRAMRDVLGYKQITVNVVSAADDERALLMEISENECRKEFTKTERLDYARRLARIEAAKAKERQGTRTDMVENSPQSSDGGKSRDKVAQALGTSSNTLSREQYIEDHKDMVSVEDFAAWDEGKLSTNRVFQQVKKAQEDAIKERDFAKGEAEVAKRVGRQLKEELAQAYHVNEVIESEVVSLKKQLSEKPEPEVVERTVEVEVAPADYEQTKKRMRDLESDNKRLSREYQDMWHKKRELDEKLNQANELLGENDRKNNARRDIEHLTVATNTYLRNYGGKAWAFDQFDRVDEVTQEEFEKAIHNLAAFAQNLSQLIASRKNG